MKTFSIACIAVVAAFPILQASNSASAQTADPCDGLEEWKYYVQGALAEDYISQNGIDQVMDEVLRGLRIDLSPQQLANYLVDFNNNPQVAYVNVPEALQGIGGFVVTLFLQKHLDEAGNVVGEGEKSIADKVLRGKIRDYIFVRGAEEYRGSGHLSVDMCTEEAGTGKMQFFHWDIEVMEDEFIVEDGAKSPDPRRPELDHKLSAFGEVIEVHHVYTRNLANQDLERIDDSIGHRYYESTAESCVDIFTEGYPPETYGELKRGEFCLGRCAHPLIVNSGD